MMNSRSRVFVGSILAFVLGAAPLFAEPYSPQGLWEAEDKESRYEVSLCGDGTQLCAELIWIRPDVINDRNKVYLNTYVVENAPRASEREWRGTINLYGHSVAGNVRLLSEDYLQVRGCALLIICERKLLVRMAEVAEETAD